MLLKQIYDPYLSQYAYLVGCPKNGEAVIFDAERDVDRYLKLAEDNDLKITAAAETHIHADFLGGVRQLVEAGDVQGYLSKEGGKDWQYAWAKEHKRVRLLSDGDSFTIGSVEITACHLPGHTPEHLCYLIKDSESDADVSFALISGDFMFVGDVGRPDLLEEAAGESGSRETSAKALFKSIQKFGELDDFLEVLPGHGAGSSCGKSLGSIPFSTVGYEKRTNASVVTALDGQEESFVEDILAGQPAPPMYFARMKNVNRDGVPLYKSLPKPLRVQPEEMAQLFADRSREIVFLDTRADPAGFMRRHLIGSIYAPFGPQFSEAAGCYVRANAHIYLLLEDVAQLEDCVRQLIRIGIDDIRGYALIDELLADEFCIPFLSQIPTIETSDIDPEKATVLDVRSAEEFAEAHVPDAYHLPHTRLLAEEDKLPDKDEKLTVHCGSGARASLASAALARMGYTVVFANGNFSEIPSVGR